MTVQEKENGGRPSLFQRQLEQSALRQIVLLVVVGCILFCVSLFGLNYLNQQLTTNEHLDFLEERFCRVYDSTAQYLLDDATQEIFVSALQSNGSTSELSYAISKQNATSEVRFNLILSTVDQTIVYSSFAAEALNLHRTEYNKIVSANTLGYQGELYYAVYYLTGSYSDYVISTPVYQGDTLLGVATIYLDGSEWGGILSEYQYDCILTTQKGNIIYCSRESLLPDRNTNTFRGLESLGDSIDTSQYHVEVSSALDGAVMIYSFLYAPGNTIYLTVGLLTIVCLGAIWFTMFLRLSKSIAAKTGTSVEALVDELRIIRQGDNTHVIHLDTGDEFEEIAKQVNRMVSSINELNQHNTDLLQLNSLIEMRNLQAQINPHFIYNTLENIKYITCTDPELAADLIQRFTNILRYSIDNTRQDVHLSQDIRYIRDYVEIQRTRFGARFTCTMDIAPDCYPCRVPKLLLQPLLENSIKYGFQHRMELAVGVRGYRQGDYLILTIEDNGPGLEPQAMAELQSRIVQETISTTHNGLQNLCRRILLEYGASSGLYIDSQPGQSFTVTAKLLQEEGAYVSDSTGGG